MSSRFSSAVRRRVTSSVAEDYSFARVMARFDEVFLRS